MLVKYTGNSDRTEGTAAISGTEAGYDIPIGGVGVLNQTEYNNLSARLVLEVVGDGWDSLTKDELEQNAARLGISLEGLSTKDEYVKAFASGRSEADVLAESGAEQPQEPVLPATATGTPGSPAAVGGGGGAAGPAGSPPAGNAGTGGGRS